MQRGLWPCPVDFTEVAVILKPPVWKEGYTPCLVLIKHKWKETEYKTLIN